MRMQGHDNMVEFINSFTGVSERLAEIGITLEEELLSIILLSSLPKYFENFVIAIKREIICQHRVH